MDKKTYKTQRKRIIEAFQEKPKTMLQVAIETGILRGNICYMVKDLRKLKQIATVRNGRCPISKHKAQFLSTNPDFLPADTQAQLFEA